LKILSLSITIVARLTSHEIDMPFFNSNDCQIYYETHGEGPALVLINGLIADHHAWRAVLPALSEKHQVVILDNRGTGRSDAPPGDYSVPQMAQDVVSLIDHLSLRRPVIVGHSLGGCMTQYIMRYHSDKIRAGVISSSFPTINTAFSHFSQVRKLIYKLDNPRQLLADSIIPWAYGSHYLSRPGIYASLRQAHLDNPHYQTEQGYHGQCAAMLAFDSRPWLADIRVPALVLVGSHDIVALPQESFDIAKAIPSATIKIIENAGHNPETEDSARFIQEVSGFITSLDADIYRNPHLYRSLHRV
jgi:3-oxoadipate enol-lactonase